MPHPVRGRVFGNGSSHELRAQHLYRPVVFIAVSGHAEQLLTVVLGCEYPRIDGAPPTLQRHIEMGREVD